MLGAALSVLACVATVASQGEGPRTSQIEGLVPGVRRVQELDGRGRRIYTVELHAGQVADGQFRGRGSDLNLKVLTPSGQVCGEFYAASTYVPFHVIATVKGVYRLEIGGVGPVTAHGGVDIKLTIFDADDYSERLDRREFGSETELYRIARDIRWRGEQAVDSVVAERIGKGPIVEPYPDDPKERYVTFLYRGDDQTEQVNTWAFELGTAPLDLRAVGTMPMPLQRLGGSTLWYLRTCLPSDTLMGYSFEVIRVHRVAQPDGRILSIRDEPHDLNDPLVADSLFGKSMLRLEDAPVQPWIVPHPDVPHGRLSPSAIASHALGEQRSFTVYTPSGAGAENPDKRLLFVFDGESYGRFSGLVPTPTVLDNLIARHLIPPTVAVFVDAQATRMRDLANFPPFARFMATELLPWVQRNYRVSRRPADTVVAGSSLGGLCAAYIAFSYPSRFGAALCQSPAMYPSPGALGESSSFVKIRDGFALTRAFMMARRKPIRFYMDSGLFEGSLLDGDRDFRDVLRLKGYPLTYVEHSGSHDYTYWRNSIGDGLIALLGRPHGVRHRRVRRTTQHGHRRRPV